MVFKKGHKHSEETKRKISLALKGKVFSEETKRKISKAKEKNYVEHPRLKEYLRLINTGKNNPNFGKHHTKETKRKISLSNKGKKLSKESCENIRLAKLDKKNPMYGKSGILSPTWQGGKSFEPYDKTFNNKFRRAIRKRDNYVCLKCGKHQEKEKKALSIHHINYDKMLSILQNCCALCIGCNSEVNFNREHWIKFFQSLLSEKYGYNYSKEEEIILNVVGKKK